MMGSRIGLFGLPHKVDVIRKAEADDGYGGISLGVVTTLYSDKRCRVSGILQTGEGQQGFGFDSAKVTQVLMEYAPKIIENDFIRVPWGTLPNTETPAALADGTPPIAVITTPGVSIPTITFTWNPSTGVWDDDVSAQASLTNNGGSWRFQNSEDSLDLTLGPVATSNPFAHSLWGSQTGYSIDQITSTKDYRITWFRHQIDDTGGDHHTSLLIELEDVDT
jgi:hypothetical protein